MEGSFSSHYDIMGYSTGDDKRPAGFAWNNANAIIKNKGMPRAGPWSVETGDDGFDSFAIDNFFGFKRLLTTYTRKLSRCSESFCMNEQFQ